MKSEMLVKWTASAAEIQEPLEKLPVPMHVLLGEAVDVARFFEHYYTARPASTAGVPRRGFEQAVRAGRLHAGLGQEILELQQALSAAQTEYLLSVSLEPAAPIERADFVLSELIYTLEFAFDDGVQDQDDARLASLLAAHGEPSSQDARAAALEDFAALADLHRVRLDGLGGFDVALIDEARTLAVRLREQSANRLLGAPPSAQRAALELRNRIASVLVERMNTVRTAARFVFRDNPELIRKVTSLYERRRRADARRAKSAKGSQEEPAAAIDG